MAIVLFSSFITLLITTLQIRDDYKGELSEIDGQFRQIRETSLESLSQSIWVVDEIQIKKQLEGILQFPYVDYVVVYNDGIPQHDLGNKHIRNIISSRFPLTYPHRGEEIIIAEIEIQGTLDTVYFRLLNKVLFILASNAFKTSLVAVFVLFLFYWILGRHIIRLADFAEKFGAEEELPSFDLERPDYHGRRHDELDTLSDSINRMIETQRGREDDLRVFAILFEQSPNSIMLTDGSAKIEYVNNYFVKLSGYTLEEVKGRRPSFLSADHTNQDRYRKLWKTITSGEIWSGEFKNRTKSGSIFWESARIAPILNKSGEISHYLAIKEDISLRKSYEEKLLYQANYDTLTDLPNRILAFDRISQAIITHKRDSGHVVIMVIDLDRFKNINDTLGHQAGDEMLVKSAKRLKSCVRAEDTIARMGGDEFLVVLGNIIGEKSIDKIAQKMLNAFSDPFSIDGRDIYVTASIGVTFYPDDGDTPQILLRNADVAMYRAKEEGRNLFRYYTQAMNEQADARLELESHLRNALSNREFEIYYQPILDATSRHVVAAEALLRWHSKALGDIPPDVFIPMAEDIGLIVPIGDWVMENACIAAASWRDALGRPLRIAVNVSVRQFTMSDLISTVKLALNESGLPAEYLEVEVTEGMLLDDNVDIQETLRKLTALGVRISMDDFGTGYSALSYLKKFTFNVLKIDRSFVRDLEVDAEDAKLSHAIIMMAHGLNMEVIGEGVETEGQLNILQEKSIDLIQGFLFSRPVPQAEFEKLLKREPWLQGEADRENGSANLLLNNDNRQNDE